MVLHVYKSAEKDKVQGSGSGFTCEFWKMILTQRCSLTNAFKILHYIFPHFGLVLWSIVSGVKVCLLICTDWTFSCVHPFISLRGGYRFWSLNQILPKGTRKWIQKNYIRQICTNICVLSGRAKFNELDL